VRYWLWWIACLKLVLVFIPAFSVPLPVSEDSVVPRTFASAAHLATPPVQNIVPVGTPAAGSPQLASPTVIACLWIVGVLAATGMLLLESLRLKGLRGRAKPLTTEASASEVRVLSVQMGLSKAPEVLSSTEATSPFVTGLIRPAIVLPAGIETSLSPQELRMAIAHELAHVKRHDLLFGLIPAAARLLFFFLPPAHLACREWISEREAVCDAEALALTNSPAAAYGDLLMKIVARDHAPAMSPCIGATASFHTLKRRISFMKTYGSKPPKLLVVGAPVLVLLGAASLFSWRFANAQSNNLLRNTSVEGGAGEWKQGAAIDGVRYAWNKSVSHSGSGSLSISKSAQRYFPIAQWSQEIDYTGSEKAIKVAAFVKAKNAGKAIIDVIFYDGAKTWIKHEWAAYIGAKDLNDAPANHDWKEYSGTVLIPEGTKTIMIGLQDYGPGSVWFDDITAQYVDPPAPAVASTGVVNNAGFEKGADGWQVDSFPPGASVNVSSGVVEGGHTGKAFMFSKSENRYFPVALYTQPLGAPAAGATKMNIKAWVRAENAYKSTIQIFFNRGQESEHREWGVYVGAKNENDPPANHDWKQYTGTFNIPPGTNAVEIAMEMYGPGRVWFDDIEVSYQ
jgi:beta-lactamase regulating signal transducer with metallopeptidase domain